MLMVSQTGSLAAARLTATKMVFPTFAPVVLVSRYHRRQNPYANSTVTEAPSVPTKRPLLVLATSSLSWPRRLLFSEFGRRRHPVVDLCNSGYDTDVSIHTAGNILYCDGDSAPTRKAAPVRLVFVSGIDAGEYIIRIGGWNGDVRYLRDGEHL